MDRLKHKRTESFPDKDVYQEWQIKTSGEEVILYETAL